nr:hypothetical protein [Lachnospiraceae bacterium]
YEELVKEMSLISNENAIIYAYERDDFAKKIRRGEIETDAVFDDLKKDYKVSIHLADDMLVDNRHVLLNSIGTAFRSQIVMQADLDERIIEESEKYAKKALTNVKVGRDANEREMFLKTITEDVPLSWSNDCGIKESKNVYTVTDEEKASNYLEKRADKYGKYVKLFSDFNELAKNTFEELKSEKIGGRSGSEEFKAFYDAVEKVQKINYSNDVYDIKKSYKELEEAAKAYKDKIDDQFFKKGSGKGRGRYSAAKTMLKEVRQYITDMDKLSDREFEVGYSLEEIFSNAAKAKKDIYTKKAVKLLDEAEREYLEQKAQKEAENNLKNAENKADNKHQKNADINVEKDDADNRRRKMSKKEVKEFLGNVKDKKEKLSSKQKNPPKTTVKETQPALGGKKKK